MNPSATFSNSKLERGHTLPLPLTQNRSILGFAGVFEVAAGLIVVRATPPHLSGKESLKLFGPEMAVRLKQLKLGCFRVRLLRCLPKVADPHGRTPDPM